MNKDVMSELKQSEKYDQKSGWWPAIVEQERFQFKIQYNLLTNLGMRNELVEIKARWINLEAKISQSVA